MTTLCPSHLNELGKGIFSPKEEARLLADGYIFACRVPGTIVGTRVLCKRPIADAVTDGELDRRQRSPTPASPYHAAGGV